MLNGDQVITLKHHGLDPTLNPDDLAKVEGNMTIKRNPRFRLFATDNTGGKMSRDPRYAGVHTQNSAVRSRFTCFKMSFMKPALELKALLGSTKGILPVFVGRSMVELAIRIRASFEIGEMTDTVSFRELQRWARKSLVYAKFDANQLVDGKPKMIPDCAKAFVDAIYTGMEESDQEVSANFYELVFGTELDLPNEYKATASKFLEQLDAGKLDWDEAA